MNRRGFLRGLLCAAPAIVAAPSLMRVSTLPAELATSGYNYMSIPASDISFADMVMTTLRARPEEIAANLSAHNALYKHLCGIPDILRGRA